MSSPTSIEAARRILLNQDPTRTVTLRRVFIADATRRFHELKRLIVESVVDRDIFDLARTPVRLVQGPADPGSFAGLTQGEKIQQFNQWLQEQEQAGILHTVPGPGGTDVPWSNQYITSAYQSGLANGLRELSAKGIDVPATTLPGVGGVGGLFHAPFHQDRVGVLFTETFTGLENVIAAANNQIQRVLAEGLAQGLGPEEIARNITNRVDKIGGTRAKLIARTEIVEAYNTANVALFEQLEGIIGEEIFVQWWTAEDERVRASHRWRHGKIYTKAEYLALIGEPNCRCTGLPYIASIDGAPDLTTAGETQAVEAEIAAKEKEDRQKAA